MMGYAVTSGRLFGPRDAAVCPVLDIPGMDKIQFVVSGVL